MATMTEDERRRRRVVAEFLGRTPTDGEILSDVFLETLALLAVRVMLLEAHEAQEEAVCCEAHKITAKTEEVRAWLLARGLLEGEQ